MSWRPTLMVSIALLLMLGCAGFERQLTYTSVRSDVMRGVRLSYSVWLPPDFDENERLPLITFLHGGGDDPASFDRHGLTEEFNAAVTEGRIPRAVIFFPQGDNGFWANWYDGSRRYQDWIIDELIPEVSRRYHTLPCPEDCHVMGVSMGGHGALRLALDRPGVFASMSALSAPIFNAEQIEAFANGRAMQIFIPVHRIWGPVDAARIRRDDPYHRWQSPDDLDGLRVFLAWGTDDRGGIRETNVAFVEHLREGGVPVEAVEYDGNHSWRSWSAVIQQAMRTQVVTAPRRP